MFSLIPWKKKHKDAIKVRHDIRAEHKDEEKKKGVSSYRYGQYSRTFTLPPGVVADEIDAHYKSGILEVHLPKDEKTQGKRITVKPS